MGILSFYVPNDLCGLPNFVFVGLPASEADNALVLPLAGHELGHSVWRRCDVGKSLTAEVNKVIIGSYLEAKDDFEALFGLPCSIDTLFNEPDVLRTLSLVCNIASRQCEEVFCDIVGVYLFGEAFIHAFEYLLLPSLGGERAEWYPPLRSRLEYMVAAAKELGQPPEHPHDPVIRESEPTLEQREQFLLRMADTAPSKLFQALVRQAKAHCEARRIELTNQECLSAAVGSYNAFVPAEDAQSVGNIVGAGWKVYKNFDEFAPDIKNRAEAFSILNNLIFKSLEVLEYEEKMKR